MPLPTIASSIATFPTTSGFLPHGYCYLWNKPLLWTHLVSDLLIGLSYVIISCSLAVLLHRARRDIPFSILFIAFGMFIIACGMTHFMEVWTLWQPHYWLSGGVKVVTALASVTTAIAMPFMVPHVHGTIQEAKQSRARELAAERAAALEENNVLLQNQAVELEQQAEEAQSLAQELEEANERLLETIHAVQLAHDDAERARREVANVLHNMADGYVALDRDWRIQFVNRTTERSSNRPASLLTGQTLWEMWPATVDSEFERQYRRAMEKGSSCPLRGALLHARCLRHVGRSRRVSGRDRGPQHLFPGHQ